MGVDSYAYLITEESVNRLPLPFQEFLKDNMQKVTLGNQNVFVQCGIEMDEYFWDGLEASLDESEKREIIEKLLEEDGCWSIDECREDYESNMEYVEACISNFNSGNIQEYAENFLPDLVSIVSDFD